MSKEQDALKLALEALEDIGDEWGFTSKRTIPNRSAAITAIREALAEQTAQQQEPVAWIPIIHGIRHRPFDNKFIADDLRKKGAILEPLYTRPQAREPLTDESIKRILDECDEGQESAELVLAFARAIEAKLREKNA